LETSLTGFCTDSGLKFLISADSSIHPPLDDIKILSAVAKRERWDATRRLAAARHECWDVAKRLTAARRKLWGATVSRRVARVVPRGCRVGSGDDDIAADC
jgi:hypothetical protein